MSLGIKPLFSRIIIKKKKLTQVGLIIIPNNAKSMETSEGEIVACGDEADTVKVGDYVIYGKYAGHKMELKDDGNEYVVLNEEDVIAIVEPKSDPA